MSALCIALTLGAVAPAAAYPSRDSMGGRHGEGKAGANESYHAILRAVVRAVKVHVVEPIVQVIDGGTQPGTCS